MNTANLLVVDDDPLILECIRQAYRDGAVRLTTAALAKQALDLFVEHKPDAVLIDVRLPDMSGLELYRELRRRDQKTPVILMSGYSTAGTAIEAMQLGAFEYLTKPFDADQLRELVARALEVSRMMRRPARLAEPSSDPDIHSDMLVGRCAGMQEVYKSIGRVASQNVTVLIRGESGSGKELVARAIYHYSARAANPFLAINCAAIPETLLESELFGHERGSFTGADRKRIGKFEQCNGGTLFLDEIGDMSPLTQTKILRVLQDQQFERVGGNETIQTNVRIIAATNRPLEDLMRKGLFREDLFYRLNVYTIHLPPLRERGEDLPMLLRYFLKRFSHELGKEIHEIPDETMDLLRRHGWPGNLRELQSVVKKAMLEATAPILLPEYLPREFRMGDSRATPTPSPSLNHNPVGSTSANPPSSAGVPGPEWAAHIRKRLRLGANDLYQEIITDVEKQLFALVLEHTRDNQSEAARILGISRSTLRAKLASF